MGKIRVKTLGDEKLEKEQEKKAQQRKEAKLAEKKAEKSTEEKDNAPTTETVKTETKAEPKKEPASRQGGQEKKFAGKKKAARSKKYQALVVMVDKSKIYPLKEGLDLLHKLKTASFDETVELHINTTETGISGMLTLPHGTGKEIKVTIASDDVIKEIEGGKVNFDVLIAAPQMMPKLAKVAKVLGPKGLIPNPKNGTISDKPEEAAKKFAGGQMRFKTEAKAPIIHLAVGKISFGAEKLGQNIKVVLNAIKAEKTKKVVLKSTMSPAIKIDYANIK